MSDDEMALPAEQKPSELELLRGMFQQQLDLAAAAARREDRMAALLERMVPGPSAAQAGPVPAPTGRAAAPAAPDGQPPGARDGPPPAAQDGPPPAAQGGPPPEARVDPASTPAPTPAPGEGAGAAAGARQRARMPAAGTPTPRLAATATLREFEAWRDKFSGYCLLTGVADLTQPEQRAALLAVLDDDWSRVVRFGLQLPDASSVTAIIDAMQKHLRRQRNVLIDRCEFNMRVQEPGETVDDFICALKEIASCCDFCRHCTDDRFRDHLVVGTSDDEARRRMLEVPDLTFQQAADLCRASESARNNSSTIRGAEPQSLRRVSQYRRERDRPASGGQRPADRAQRCDRCGAAQHSDARDCRALGRTCHACHGRDHFSAVCWRAADEDGRRRSAPGSAAGRQGQARRPRSPSRRRQGSPADAAGESRRQVATVFTDMDARDATTEHQSTSPETRVSDALLQGVSSRRSPQVRLQLQLPGGDWRSTLWTPDTGAETSAVSIRQAESMGVRDANLIPSTATLRAADGRKLDCLGTCDFTLRLGDTTRTVHVSVLRSLHSPLLSWHDCVGMGILPATFPEQIRQISARPGHSSPERTPTGAVSQTAAGGRHPMPRFHDEPTASRAPEAPVQNTITDWSADDVGSPGGATTPVHRAVTGGDISTDQRAVSSGAPSANQRRTDFEAMKAEFPRVFDVKSTLRTMTGEAMRIELTDDAVPHAVTTARNIPFCWRDDVRRQLNELTDKGIIEPVEHPTAWCHPIVPVAKRSANGEVSGCRLTVDFTKLNRYVKRPTYPVRAPQDAVASIPPGARLFTKLDSKAGYHQVPIRPEDMDLTCFITPWGRFRYKRAPMGIVSSGDIYNQRGDAALGDIPRTCKVVDDVLAYDSDYAAHLQHVRQILKKCDERGITLNPDKCQFAEEEVEFCGFRISPAGYTADDKKVRAIKAFPKPSNITDLRSFLGLVNQLGAFSTDVARAAEPLRQLLRPRNAWLWTPAHEEAFAAVKRALLSPPVLDFFDPRRRTVLETDAARTGGLGYCLLQEDAEGRWRLVQCGSRFLSDTESRYAVIELELLAIVWACKKCSLYLSGMQRFEIMTDHRPLVPILNSKSLAEIDNPRLQRLRERLTAFNLFATWRDGKRHAIPDALSRAPVDDPAPDDAEAEEDVGHQITSLISRLGADVTDDAISPFKDAALTEVRAAAAADPEITALAQLILAGFPEHRSQLDPLLRPYWGLRDRLAVDDGLVVCGQRLVMPRSLRRVTLERLHASHQGIERTKRRARQVVYWPHLDQDITNFVSSCRTCQQYLPSQQKEPLVPEKTPSRVFQAVSADYFAWGGRTFLVYADRLSGWPFVSHVTGEATSRDLICSLRQMFAITGVPNTLRTDGGPQFAARTTREFLRRWGVEHEISTPHYPQSNGHAEAAVKAAKRLIQKATTNGNLDTDAYAQGLLELRNTPRADGRSPAQVLFGHPLRSTVPAHHRAFAACWQRAADACDAKAAAQQQQTIERYDSSARNHRPLLIGQRVLVQDPRSGLWDRTGVVTGIGKRRDFLIRLPSGRILWRNRRYLRPQRSLITEGAPTAPPRHPPARQRLRPGGEEADTPSVTTCVRPSVRAGAPPLEPSPPPDGPSVGETDVAGRRASGQQQQTDTAQTSRQQQTGGVSPPPVRRSTRSRRRPARLTVRWSDQTYE